MYSPRNSRPCRQRPGASVRRGLAVAFGLVGLALGALAGAQDLRDGPPALARDPFASAVYDDDRQDPGHFEVREARTRFLGGVYFLDASIALRLSAEARQALQSGVPLTIRLDVELLNPRRFWFDGTDAALRQRYQLEYHALSERYIVTNLNSGDQTSFGSLLLALDHLGRVERLPLIDAAVLDDHRGYEIRIRAALDVEQFPGPLRLLAFWRRDWSLASEWYRWPLQRD